MWLRILPALRVHCWGGLGSQLFAWALLEDLKIKYPQRKFRLILHQSGVTKRIEEIARFFPMESSICLDYVPVKHETDYRADELKFSLVNSIKTSFVSLLSSLRLLSNCNSDTDLDSVRFWTIQIRGHYSYRRITASTIAAMNSRANSQANNLINRFQSTRKEIAVHYRLGDLLILDSKGPIHSSRITEIIGFMTRTHEISRVVVYSDSPKEASHRFGGLSSEYKGPELNAWNTLLELQQFEVFISTNSKISIWATLIRAHFSPQLKNFVPREFERQFSCNLVLDNHRESITYY